MSSTPWGDYPTWVSAIATVLAAVGAFFAAGIAFNQLKGQRQELERQRGEQQKLAELQAKQLEQLDQQSEVNKRQIERLDQQARALRRSQADQVVVCRSMIRTYLVVGGPGEYEGVVISNDSRRPVWNVRLYRIDADGTHVLPRSQRPAPFSDTGTPDFRPEKPVDVVRPGGEIYAVWPLDFDESEDPVFAVEFTDDAGVSWKIDQHAHLEELPATV